MKSLEWGNEAATDLNFYQPFDSIFFQVWEMLTGK